jgi:hypothetical protein
VFQTDRDRDVEIYAMNASDGSNLRRVTDETPEPSDDVFPAWRPAEEDGSFALPEGEAMLESDVVWPW